MELGNAFDAALAQVPLSVQLDVCTPGDVPQRLGDLQVRRWPAAGAFQAGCLQDINDMRQLPSIAHAGCANGRPAGCMTIQQIDLQPAPGCFVGG